MATRPFPVDAKMTAIALAYRNEDVDLIADRVMPRTPTAAQFKWTSYAADQFYTAIDTQVGRKSRPNEVELLGTEVEDKVLDYGLDDVVPWSDVNDDNQGFDPIGNAVMFTTSLVQLAREARVAATVFNVGNHTNNITLSGTGQWSDYVNSNPHIAIMEALDIPLKRPNIMVIGRAGLTKLRLNPKMVQAIYGNNSTAGSVSRQQLADFFEIKEILVGEAFINTAKRGQVATMSRAWGKDCALLYREKIIGPQAGVTWGFTAEATKLQSGMMPDPMTGLEGAERVRVGERIKEVVSAPGVSYLFKNCIA